MIRARLDATLRPVLGGLVSLRYREGASPSDDVPAHVRAASALRRQGSRLVVIQDDVNVLALRGDDGALRPTMLPAGPGGRRVFDDTLGNKSAKMDLEACVVLPGRGGSPSSRLVALGSGSSPARETWVVLEEKGAPRLVDARALYAGLRAETAFAGSELNVEGAVVTSEQLWLFQRGNGAARDGLLPVNAIGALELEATLRWLDDGGPAPRLVEVRAVDLGEVEGARFGFTDAAVAADGRVAVLACAEASPDAVQDGPVLGCRFGWLEGNELRMADVVDEQGRRTALKLEGLEGDPSVALRFDVVADMDRPEEAALFGRLDVVEG